MNSLYEVIHTFLHAQMYRVVNELKVNFLIIESRNIFSHVVPPPREFYNSTHLQVDVDKEKTTPQSSIKRSVRS